MQDFRNLQVWQKAHELALLTYQLTADFPREELFGLRNSLRKTAVDIAALIAEGCGKPSDVEFSKSLASAFGFCTRLEYYVLIARDLDLMTPVHHEDLIEKIVDIKKMLSSFNRRLGDQS